MRDQEQAHIEELRTKAREYEQKLTEQRFRTQQLLQISTSPLPTVSRVASLTSRPAASISLRTQVASADTNTDEVNRDHDGTEDRRMEGRY